MYSRKSAAKASACKIPRVHKIKIEGSVYIFEDTEEKMDDICSGIDYYRSIRHDFLCSRKSRLKCKDRRTG